MSAWTGVVVAAVVLALALFGAGQPAWQWRQSQGSAIDAWSYSLFGATHTVKNGTTGAVTSTSFTYVQLPGQAHLAALFQLLQYALLALVAAAIASAALAAAAARRKVRGVYAGAAMVAGCLVTLLLPLYLVLELPAAAAADLPTVNGTPIMSFEGNGSFPVTGGTAIVTWGAALAWYLFLVLSLALAVGATEVWSVKPAPKRAAKPLPVPSVRRTPLPPPEPPAPARQEPVIEEVFVIGANGLLIKHMSRTLMSEKDRDVVGGMISILSNFVRQTFTERDGGDVQEITLGDHRFILCNDSGVVVAVLVTRGATEDIVPRLRHLIALLADRYGEKLESWGGEPLEGIEDEIAVLWQPFFAPPPPLD